MELTNLSADEAGQPINYSIAIAGSTNHTQLCAEALHKDPRFQICWILTPGPRLVGRKQELVKNPMHIFAEKNNIPVILVDKKIDEGVRKEIDLVNQQTKQLTNKPTDFLLVVDFGYFIPNWLLKLPSIAPINIHPSELPKFRGSSPGQFTLLYGEKVSAVSVIIMNDKLDEGDLIYQDKFTVLDTWTAEDYYQFSFNSISVKLPNILSDFASGALSTVPQPLHSPTPIARRLTREDGFVDWELLCELCDIDKGSNSEKDLFPRSPLLIEVNHMINNWVQTIDHAVKALSPWPGVWTMVSTNKGPKRMKVLSTNVKNGRLELLQVQIEGSNSSLFSQVKASIL